MSFERRLPRRREGPSSLLGKAPPYKEPTRPLDPIVYLLRKRRYELGMSIPKLAAIMEYDHATIGAWECGTHPPKLESLHAWCIALGGRLKVEFD